MPQIAIREPSAGYPFNQVFSFRLNKVHVMNIKVQALINKSDPSTLARHWLMKGAAADGVDLEGVI